MTKTTVLTDKGALELDARWAAGRPWVTPGASEAALGWAVKPEGLCRGGECVLLDQALVDGELDLLAAAELVGRPALADADAAAVVLGAEHDLRVNAIESLELPDITLPLLSGGSRSLHSWVGQKKLLAVFASW